MGVWLQLLVVCGGMTMGSWLPGAHAAVRLPPVISSGMVLQTNWENGNRAQLWGWAEPLELVTLTVGQRTWTAQAAASVDPAAAPEKGGGALFKMQLNGMAELGGSSPTQGPQNTGINLTFSGEKGPPITLERVLVGEVFVCVGDTGVPDSPMVAPLAKRTSAASDSSVRLFSGGGGWHQATAAAVAKFPALCYLPALQATDTHFSSARKGSRNLGIVLVRSEAVLPLADWRAPAGEAYHRVLAPLQLLRFRSMTFAPAFSCFASGRGSSRVGGESGEQALLPGVINSWRDAAGWGDWPVVGISTPPHVETASSARLTAQSMLPSASIQTTGLAVASDLPACMEGGAQTVTLASRLSTEILHATVGFACIGAAPSAQYGCSPRAHKAVVEKSPGAASITVSFDAGGGQALQADPAAVIQLQCGPGETWANTTIARVLNRSVAVYFPSSVDSASCTHIRFVARPMAAIYSTGNNRTAADHFPAYDFLLPILTTPQSAVTPSNSRTPPIATKQGHIATDEEWNSRRSLDNGLALTPVLGWETWNAYHATFGERLIRETVDAMVSSGMKAAGYQYVIFDEWSAKERDAAGELQPDARRFPSGVKALCDYIHQKDLKCGIYTTCGPETCQRRAGTPPSSAEVDAASFVGWGADYVFVDACGNRDFYETFSRALNRTGRPVVIEAHGPVPSVLDPWVEKVANLWRIVGDLQFNWESVLHEVRAATHLAQFAGPGHWNFLDIMEVGDAGLTVQEMRSHFALWSIIASPMLAGNIVQGMDASTRDILTSTEIIQVNQDPLGKQGRPVGSHDPPSPGPLPGPPPPPPGLRANIGGAACNASDPRQLWSIDAESQSISNVAVGGCLTTYRCSEGAGDSLVVFDCVHKSCQDFTLKNQLLSVSGTDDCVAAGSSVSVPPHTSTCPAKATAALAWSTLDGTLRASVGAGEQYCLTAQAASETLGHAQPLTTHGAVWSKPLISGSWAVALLNPNETKADVAVNFGDLNISGSAHVRDLWAKRDLGTFHGSFVAKGLLRHDTAMVKITPVFTAVDYIRPQYKGDDSDGSIQSTSGSSTVAEPVPASCSVHIDAGVQTCASPAACLTGAERDCTTFNITWSDPDSSGFDIGQSSKRVVFGEPFQGLVADNSTNVWCAAVSVEAAHGLVLEECTMKKGSSLDSCVSASCLATREVLVGQSIQIVRQIDQFDEDTGNISRFWVRSSNAAVAKTWMVVAVKAVDCGNITLRHNAARVSSTGIFVTLAINTIVLFIVYLGVSFLFWRKVRKVDSPPPEQRVANATRRRASSNAVSTTVGDAALYSNTLDSESLQASILVQSALLEKEVWRLRFMRQWPLQWPIRVWMEPTETFVKIGGRRVLPYLRFQRLLIGLYAFMCFISIPMMGLNFSGDCCSSGDCFTGISGASGNIVQKVTNMCQLSSQNISGSTVWKLYGHFAVVVVFSLASIFIARGVQRGEQTSFRLMRDMVWSVLLCKGARSPWRPGSLSAASSTLSPRGRADLRSQRVPREAYSVMIRKIPSEVPDLQNTLKTYLTEAGHGWVVHRVDLWKDGSSNCTAFVTFETDFAAKQFVASFQCKYRGQCLKCIDPVVENRHLMCSLPSPPESLWMDCWEVDQGPESHHVEWDYLNMSKFRRNIRQVLLYIILLPIFIACSFTMPIALEALKAGNIFFTTINAGEIIDVKQFPSSVQDVNNVHFTKECNTSCVFLSKYVPTLFQLIINVGLIPAIIDFITPLEGHYLRSRMFRSVLQKNTIMTSFATLIAPTLALSSGADLLSWLKKWGSIEECHANDLFQSDQWLSSFDKPVEWVSSSFGSAFLEDDGPYFFIFMGQASILGTAAGMCCTPRLGWKCINKCFGLKGQNRILWEFPLEFMYGINCAIFGIILTYSIAFPLILPLGLLFGILRHFTDKFTIIFAHQGNLDRHFEKDDHSSLYSDPRRSEGPICDTVGNSMMFSVLFFQLAMVFFFKHKKNGFLSGATSLLFLATVALSVQQMCSRPRKEKAPKVRGMVASSRGVLGSWEEGDITSPLRAGSVTQSVKLRKDESGGYYVKPKYSRMIMGGLGLD